MKYTMFPNTTATKACSKFTITDVLDTAAPLAGWPGAGVQSC